MPMPLKKKGKISPKSSASTIIKKGITPPSVLKKKCKKLVSIVATFTPVIATRKEALGAKDAKTGGIGENGKNDKNGDEDSKINLVQISCIRYSII